MSLPQDLIEIINAIQEPDTYRHQARIQQAIHDYAMSHLAPVQEGYTRVGVVVDYDNGTATTTDRLTSEIEAEARAAYVAKCQPYFPQMVVYRATLRKYFGDNPPAETNRDMTRDTVAAYFMAKQMDGTITTLETADAFALTVNFERLSELVGANPPNTWELPWEAVP